MTTMKKLFALMLAVLMLLSVCALAFGETINNSITITDAKPGETYTLYTLFDLAVDDATDPKVYSYTINSGWNAFFEGEGNKYIEMDETNTYVENITDPEALAKAAAEWTDKPKSDKSVEVAAGKDTAVFTGLSNGYHLITSSLGTLAMADTTPDNNEVTINEKNPEDTIVKKVEEDSSKEYGENNDAQIGELINFQSKATLIPNTRNVVIHDTMDDGLTYTIGSVEIAGLTKNTDYTLFENPDDGHTFDIVFDEGYLSNLKEITELTITYTASLNAEAVVEDEDISIADQKNVTQITYGDKQSVEDFTTTTTHKFSVHKHAEGDTENLAGATFSLRIGSEVVKLVQIDEANYRVATTEDTDAVETFTTVADKDIVIWGVDSDKYSLVETKAPDGYNVLNDSIEVTVDANNALCIDVENKSGAKLPETGGIGTTIFYVVGGVLVLLAVVLLVTKRRVGENN